MTTEIAMRLSGFLLLFILSINVAMAAFGNYLGIIEDDSDTKLQKINDNPTS